MKKYFALLIVILTSYALVTSCTGGKKARSDQPRRWRTAQKIAELKKDDAFKHVSIIGEAAPTTANKTRAGLHSKPDHDILNIGMTRQMIMDESPENLKITLPAGGKIFQVSLTKANIVNTNIIIDGKQAPLTRRFVDYTGTVDGEDSSIVTITASQYGIDGVITDRTGRYVIESSTEESTEFSIAYIDTTSAPFDCGAMEIPDKPAQRFTSGMATAEATNKCVQWLWETDYDLYVSKGSNLAALEQYVHALFVQVQALYYNDGVNISLKTLVVNTSVDSYTGPSTSVFLSQFGDKVSQYGLDADLGMLLGTQGSGGIAWINGLGSLPRYRTGYAAIHSSFNTVPSYSWSVEVMAHEMGHLLGSSHTHDCYQWANQVRIDSCGPSRGYYGNCDNIPPAPIRLPIGGGTIMSYCHLTSAGINFLFGFGLQVSSVFIYVINNADLDECGSPPPPPPPPPPVNQAPVARAGTDQIINLPVGPNTVSVSGITSSDPDGSITNYQWTVVQGSGTLSNQNVVSTFVNNLSAGTTQIQLLVTDNKGAQSKDTVKLIVNVAPPPPPGSCPGWPTDTCSKPTRIIVVNAITQRTNDVIVTRSGYTNYNYKWCRNDTLMPTWKYQTVSKTNYKKGDKLTVVVGSTNKQSISQCWKAGTRSIVIQ